MFATSNRGRSRCRTSSTLTVEALEHRRMLTTVLVNSTGDIGDTNPGEGTCLTAANTVRRDTSEFSVAVSCSILLDGLTLRVNGTPEDDRVDLTLRGSEYFVDASFLPPEQPVISFDASLVQSVEIRTRRGNDTINADLNVVGGVAPDDNKPVEFNVFAGAGNDSIDLNVAGGVAPDDNKPAEFNVFSGDGNDSIDLNVVGGVTPDDGLSAAITVRSGPGNDVTTGIFGFHSQPELPNFFVLDLGMGPGDDVVDLTQTIETAGTSVPTQLRAARAPDVRPHRFETTINGGRGHDNISFQGEASVNLPTELQLSINGNSDADTINVQAKVGQASGIEPTPFVPELNASGGPGADRITVGIEPVSGVEPTPFRLLVDGGGGGDAIFVRTEASTPPPRTGIPSSEVEVRGGAGYDFIVLFAHGPVSAYDTLFVDGGRDFDVCLSTENVSVINCEVTWVIEELFGQGEILLAGPQQPHDAVFA